jgi:hypothetical protein
MDPNAEGGPPKADLEVIEAEVEFEVGASSPSFIPAQRHVVESLCPAAGYHDQTRLFKLTNNHTGSISPSAIEFDVTFPAVHPPKPVLLELDIPECVFPATTPGLIERCSGNHWERSESRQ